MDIDLAALRALERERDISLDVLIPAIEQALLVAYHRTDGAYRSARVELDRKTGHVVVLGREEIEQPEPRRASDPSAREHGPSSTTPRTGFGRIAASTARQVIVQRLRDLEDERDPRRLQGPRGRRSSRRSSSRARTRGSCPSTSARSRASCPSRSRCRESSYVHGERLRCFVVVRQARPQGPADRPVAHPPQPGTQAVRARGARDRRRHRRDRGPGPRGRAPHQDRGPLPRCPGVNAKGACIGPMGARVRAVMTELHGEKIDIVDYADDPAVFVAAALSPARVQSVEIVDATARAARVVVPDYQLSLAIGKEGQNARLAAKLTGWRIDIRPDTEPAGCPEGGASSAGPARQTVIAGAPVERGRPRDAVDSCVADRTGLRAEPSRTCVGCRGTDSWSALLRVVAATDESRESIPGVIRPDPRHRLPGRGAWLHPDRRLPRPGRAPPSVRACPATAGRGRAQRGGRAPRVSTTRQQNGVGPPRVSHQSDISPRTERRVER